MTLYAQQNKNRTMVNISVENADSGGCNLVFTPSSAGIAHLAVTVGGRHLKNSPYVVQVRALALEDAFDNLPKVKKTVKFDEISL